MTILGFGLNFYILYTKIEIYLVEIFIFGLVSFSLWNMSVVLIMFRLSP